MEHMPRPLPRYIARQAGPGEDHWIAWDTKLNWSVSYNPVGSRRNDVERYVATLNHEYERWQTERFYHDAEYERWLDEQAELNPSLPEGKM